MNTYYKAGRFEARSGQIIDKLDQTILGTTVVVKGFHQFVPRDVSLTETTLRGVCRLLRYMNQAEYDKRLGPKPDMSDMSNRLRYGIARARCHGREVYRGRISAFSPEQINQIVQEFHARKMSVVKLAEKWDISRAYVYMLVKKYGDDDGRE